MDMTLNMLDIDFLLKEKQKNFVVVLTIYEKTTSFVVEVIA